MHMLWPYVTSVSCHQVKFVISHTQVLQTLTGDDIVQKQVCPWLASQSLKGRQFHISTNTILFPAMTLEKSSLY